MIDFRYHLVSLVSVFIALAIGVVLGAGPLGGALGDTLNNQIVALREDKVDLQQAVTNRDETIAAQDSAISVVSPALVSGTMTGQNVALVLLPGASDSQVDAVRSLLDGSGATIVATVEIQQSWTNPAAGNERRTALTQAPSATAGQSEADRLATLLAGSLVSEAPGQPVADPDPLEALTSSGLITLTRAQPVTADRVILIGPAASAGRDAPQPAEAEGNLALVRALGQSSARVVAAAPSDSNQGVVGQVLADRDLASATSTVDNLPNAAGPLAAVLALAQPSGTAPGHYGIGSAASAVLPPVPAADGQPAEAGTP